MSEEIKLSGFGIPEGFKEIPDEQLRLWLTEWLVLYGFSKTEGDELRGTIGLEEFYGWYARVGKARREGYIVRTLYKYQLTQEGLDFINGDK